MIGGFARTAPAVVRNPSRSGVLAVVLLGLLQRIVPIVFVELGFEADWLYRPASGLTFLGATVIFAIAVVADACGTETAGGPATVSARPSMRPRPPRWGCSSRSSPS